MKFVLTLLGAIALSACAAQAERPPVADAPLAQYGPVALAQPAQVGSLIATPIKVVEDSRCPREVHCVWAGQLVLRTSIEGAGWRETIDLTLGKEQAVRGTRIALASVTPERTTEGGADPANYRFVFEGGI